MIRSSVLWQLLAHERAHREVDPSQAHDGRSSAVRSRMASGTTTSGMGHLLTDAYANRAARGLHAGQPTGFQCDRPARDQAGSGPGQDPVALADLQAGAPGEDVAPQHEAAARRG